MTKKEKNSDSLFSVIKISFQPILEKGFSKGSEDLKKSEHLPLVIMVIAGLAAIIVSFITLVTYIFREYLHDYVNIVLVWAAFALSVVVLLLAIKNAKSKENKHHKISDILFSAYFLFNFFLVIIFQFFYQFGVFFTFSLMIVNVFVSFTVSFVRKINILGILSYFSAISLPLLYLNIEVTYYLPYLFLTTLAFLLFAEYVSNNKLNILISVITFGLYYYLLKEHASAENKYFFLSFVFLFSYLYLFFDFIVYKALEEKIYTKNKFSKTDYFIIGIIQVFIIGSIFTFFSGNLALVSFVFLLNALPFAGTHILFKNKLNKEGNSIIVSLSVLYILFSVSVFFWGDNTILVFLVSLLSLIVLNFGFLKDRERIRKISYSIIALSILYFLYFGTIDIIGHWGTKLLHAGYYKFIYIQIILSGLLYVLFQNKSRNFGNESIIHKLNKSFTVIWISLLYIITLWHLVSFVWVFTFLALPFYILLYFGRDQNNRTIEIIAYLGILLIAFISINIAYYEIVENWLVTLYSVGFAYLFYFGFLLIVLRYLIRALNTTYDFAQQQKYSLNRNTKTYRLNDETKSKSILKLIDYTLQIWVLFILLLFIKYYTGYWFSFIALIPAFAMISWSYIYKQNFSKNLGYLVYALVALKILIYSFSTQNGVSLFNLLQIGFFILLIWFTRINVFYFNRKVSIKAEDIVVNQTYDLKVIESSKDRIKFFFTSLLNFKFELKDLEYEEDWLKRRINNLFYSLTSIWFSIFLFLITYYIPGEINFSDYSYSMPFFTMFILLYIAGRLESNIIEWIALSNGAFLLIGAFASFESSGFSLHLSAQPVWGRILIVQIFLAFLVLLKFYEYFVEFSFKDEFMYLLNRIALALLPFIVFYLIYRRFEFLVRFSPWIALAISLLLSEIYKLRVLIYESIFWLLVSSLFVFIFPIPSVTIVGLFVLIPYVFYKKGFSARVKNYPRYEFLPTFIILYSIFAIFRVYLLVESDFSGGFFLASSFIFTLLFFQNNIYPVKKMNRMLYYVANFLILVGFFFFYKDTNFAYDFRSSSYRIISLVFMPFSLMIMHKLLFNPKAYPGFSFIYELFVVNIYYIATYSLLIYYFTSEITHITITIALFVHGITILFRSVKPRFNLLAIIAIFVFVLAIAKLFIVDIQGFSIVSKLSLFMLIGFLFFGAALFFSRKRKRLLDEKKQLEQNKLETPLI